jgi:hypothetical protein
MSFENLVRLSQIKKNPCLIWVYYFKKRIKMISETKNKAVVTSDMFCHILDNFSIISHEFYLNKNFCF